MDYFVVGLVSMAVAALTLFSGFGLGSLLMPAFALFFPLHVAVGATAIVHLANNLFKLALVGKHASLPIALRFGGPAVPAAFAGALMLGSIAAGDALLTYTLAGRSFSITLVGLVMGLLILVFSLADLLPFFDRLRLGKPWLPVGGVLSGLFGGISGHQGALRAAFLINCGLGRDAFIGTNVVCAVMVDVVRLTVYGTMFLSGNLAATDGPPIVGLVVAATGSAFCGSFLGARYMEKVTLGTVRRLVGALLLLLGLAVAAGWV